MVMVGASIQIDNKFSTGSGTLWDWTVYYVCNLAPTATVKKCENTIWTTGFNKLGNKTKVCSIIFLMKSAFWHIYLRQ